MSAREFTQGSVTIGGQTFTLTAVQLVPPPNPPPTPMLITREMLRSWNACYSDARIAALVPECGLTVQQVAHATHVPRKDRLWVLTAHESLPFDWIAVYVSWLRIMLTHAGLTEALGEDLHRRLCALVEAYAQGDLSHEEHNSAREAARAVEMEYEFGKLLAAEWNVSYCFVALCEERCAHSAWWRTYDVADTLSEFADGEELMQAALDCMLDHVVAP